MNAVRLRGEPEDLRFTIYDLRFTIYDLRFTIAKRAARAARRVRSLRPLQVALRATSVPRNAGLHVRAEDRAASCATRNVRGASRRLQRPKAADLQPATGGRTQRSAPLAAAPSAADAPAGRLQPC